MSSCINSASEIYGIDFVQDHNFDDKTSFHVSIGEPIQLRALNDPLELHNLKLANISLDLSIDAQLKIDAGLLVTKNIPANCVDFGSPCRKITQSVLFGLQIKSHLDQINQDVNLASDAVVNLELYT